MDKEFAQRIYSDLETNKFDAWIDTLDLKAGKMWDIQIEKEMEVSDCMLALLSKNSVLSKEVINEIYFGIDENKNVIPILVNKCKLPYRLRRLQYIDLSNDYNTGFGQLVAALNSDGNYNIETKLTFAQKIYRWANKYKFPIISLIALVIGYVGYRVIANTGEMQPSVKKKVEMDTATNKNQSIINNNVITQKSISVKDADIEAWQLAKSKDNLIVYKTYQATFPKGEYYLAAQDAIIRLTLQQNTKQDEMTWKETIRIGSIDGYNKYIAVNKSGKHVMEAKQLITQIIARKADDDAWAIASIKNTKIAFEQYINSYPTGHKIIEAKDKLKSFAKYSIGQPLNGGLIFYIDSTAEHGLIGSEENLSESADIHAISKIIGSYKPKGFDNWRVPSLEELNLLFINRSVFQGFRSKCYWSSTKVNGTNSYFVKHFGDGGEHSVSRNFGFPLRAIKSF